MTVPRIAGIHTEITIQRDPYGIAHVRAENEDDAWFGQGYVAAQDRLWQIEYDRRRALGRWSEVAGPSVLAGDTLSRRLQLHRSAQADAATLSPDTHRMFESYCAGVNSYISSDEPLPPEYAATGTSPETLTPTHSCAIFKIRHVLMGPWQKKLAQAQLLARIGPDAYAKLDGRPPVGSAVILPPDAGARRTFEVSSQDLQTAVDQLGFLAPTEGGSNSWVVHGSRTTTGKPVICNDSHRALDVPSVYWQVHVTCPEFDVAGAAFPGLPGFPHFAHNAHLAWNITHTAADNQDLYLERLGDSGSYLTKDGWRPLEQSTERIEIAGAEPVEITLLRTHHGPIVHGPVPSPSQAYTGTEGEQLAISLRYTATEEPNRGFECLRPMLFAHTVKELFETQREWVDPVNNLVAADTEGNIGYLTRGYLPIRSSQAHRQFPAPGWDGAGKPHGGDGVDAGVRRTRDTGNNEWTGRVPHERLPQSINPEPGFIATANQQVIPEDDPFISHDFSAPSRAERLRELVRSAAKHSPETIFSWQSDVTSIPARTWSTFLSRLGPYTNEAELARSFLSNFTGHLHPDNPQALLYAHFRRSLARALFQPITGPDTWTWITASDNTSIHAIITRCMANVVASISEETTGASLTLNGQLWDTVLQQSLTDAWRNTTELAGRDPQAWRWGPHHTTNARHPLSARFPENASIWNPPKVPRGGDGDTICVASYLWRYDPTFDVVGLPVYRQAIDLSDLSAASFIIPGGVSANPNSAHYQDQLPLWAAGHRIPMHSSASTTTSREDRKS